MSDAIIPAPMTPLAARDCINRVKEHWQAFWFELKRFHDERGWIALGDATFQACVERELGFTRQRAYQLIDAARIREELACQHVLTLSTLTEGHARELKPLPSDVRAEVARRVDFGETPIRELREIVRDVRDAESDDGAVDYNAVIQQARERYQARSLPQTPPLLLPPADFPEEEEETPEAKAFYFLGRQRAIQRYTPQAIVDAALNPAGDLAGFEEFYRWMTIFMIALRERAQHPLRVAK